MFLSVLLSGQLLYVSSSKLCEAGGGHCGAQKDIRESGHQHLCEFMKYFIKDEVVNWYCRTHSRLRSYVTVLSITDIDNV